MSIYARLRVLLALSVLVIGGSVWLTAGQQRDAVIGMQGQLRADRALSLAKAAGGNCVIAAVPTEQPVAQRSC